MGRVVIYCHEFQVIELVIDPVNVEHVPHTEREEEAHKQTDTGDRKAPVVLFHQSGVVLHALGLHKEDSVKTLGLLRYEREVFKWHVKGTYGLSDAVFGKELLKVGLAKIYHLKSAHSLDILSVYIAVMGGVNSTSWE